VHGLEQSGERLAQPVHLIDQGEPQEGFDPTQGWP
jgi:hypothetical protein